MGKCYITRRGTKTSGTTEQLGVYPTGEDGRPTGNVTVLNNVTNLSKHLFFENSNVLTVALPESLRELANYCFQKCTGLQDVTIPNKVTTIPQYCFDGCSSLSKVTLSKGLTTISQYAFQNCTGLSGIVIPNGLKTIGSYAFQNCTSLADVTIDENASYELNTYAFSECSLLTNESVHNIMEHCSSVSTYVFSSCTGLTNVEVSRFWTDMFTNCINLITAKSLIGKDTGNSVFYGCTSLEEVYIADGTTKIGKMVFYKCTSLKTVYLPSSIITDSSSSLTSTSNSYYAFYNCTALEDVQLGQDWNMSLRLNVSNNLTVDSMVAMFNSLKDLTGETAKTLTLGETNLAKLTDEQKAIAINKNWTLA